MKNYILQNYKTKNKKSLADFCRQYGFARSSLSRWTRGEPMISIYRDKFVRIFGDEVKQFIKVR